MPNNDLMVKRVIGNVLDMQNLIPDGTWMDALEEAAEGESDIMPHKTLRERGYGLENQPLIIQPGYQGDFLNKLRGPIKADNAENIYDFSSPSEMLKHQEEPHPNDQTDEFVEFNRPGLWGPEVEDSEDDHWDYWYKGRENNQEWIPDMTLDRELRQMGKPTAPPFPPSLRKVANRIASYHIAELFSVDFLMEPENIKTAKKLTELEESFITTKSKGKRRVDRSGVNVRLKRAEPKIGRWTFYTTSGKKTYLTIFNFDRPERKKREKVTALDVRVSCTCPSWLFYGAQYNAFRNNYLYGAPIPVLAPPKLRDPKGEFKVCKHVIACMPIVSNYIYGIGLGDRGIIKRKPGMPAPLRPEGPPGEVVERRPPKAPVRIPPRLMRFTKEPILQRRIKDWEKMDPEERSKIVMEQTDPEAVAYLAYKFPDTATEFVADRLKEMMSKGTPEVKRVAGELLRGII